MDDWLIIYRTYSDSELEDEITFLKEESRNIYTQQGLGQRSSTRDTIAIKNRLSAAIRVKEERSGRPTNRNSVADFSGGVG